MVSDQRKSNMMLKGVMDHCRYQGGPFCTVTGLHNFADGYRKGQWVTWFCLLLKHWVLATVKDRISNLIKIWCDPVQKTLYSFCGAVLLNSGFKWHSKTIQYIHHS